MLPWVPLRDAPTAVSLAESPTRSWTPAVMETAGADPALVLQHCTWKSLALAQSLKSNL